MDLFSQSRFLNFLSHLWDTLFTGLMIAADIAFVFRFLRVRGVTLKVEVESRDQDHGNWSCPGGQATECKEIPQFIAFTCPP